MATEEIEQLLTCPICLETLRTPKVLLCQHSLCCDCLKRYVFSCGYDQHVTCPSCRLPTPLPCPGGTQGVDGLPTSFVLNSLIDAVFTLHGADFSGGKQQPLPGSAAAAEVAGHADAMACDCCRHERRYVVAAMRCLDCDEYLCGSCVRMHRRNKKSQQDRLVAVDEYLATCDASAAAAAADGAEGAASAAGGSSAPRRRPVTCPVHPGFAASSYCVPCDRLACAACAASDCRSHRRVMIALAAERARQRLLERRERLGRRSAEQSRRAAELDAALVDAVEVERGSLVELSRLHEALRAAVGDAYAAAAARLQAAAQANRAGLQGRLDETRARLATLEGSARRVDELLTRDDGPVDDDAELLVAVSTSGLKAAPATAEPAAGQGFASYDVLHVIVPPLAANREGVDRELQRAFGLELTVVAKPPVAPAADLPSPGTPPLILFGDDGGAAAVETTCSSVGAALPAPPASPFPVDASPAADSGAASATQLPASPAAARPVPWATFGVPPDTGGAPAQAAWSDAVPATPVAAAGGAAAAAADDEGLMWRKICDIDTGRSCVRGIAFNVDGKLLAACDDGLKVAVREGISATLLHGDSSLVAVSEGGLIVVVLRAKKELRCYYQGGTAAGSGGCELKQLWRRALQFKLTGPLSLATQGDRVVLLVDGAVNVYRLTDGNLLRVFKKATDGAPLFAGPSAVALDHRGRVVLTECQGGRIRAVDDQGATVWEHDGGAAAQGAEYCGLCIDAYGDVYAADARNHRVVLLTAEDRSMRSLRSVHGYIHCPTHLAIYKRTVAVCHTSVHRISVFRLSDSRSPGLRLSDATAPECTV